MSVGLRRALRRTPAEPARAACLALALLGAAPAAGAVELKLAHDAPQTHPLHAEILPPFVRQVAAATLGEVNIRVYPRGGFSEAAAMVLARLVDGRVGLAVGPAAESSQRLSATALIGAPGLARPGAALVRRAWRVVQPYIADDFRGVTLLALWPADPTVLMSRHTPIRKVDDLVGVRVGVTSPLQAAVLKAFGATPVRIEPSAVAGTLMDGAVAVVAAPASSIESDGLLDVIRFVTVGLPLGRQPLALVMNEEAAAKLAQRYRRAIAAAAGLKLSLRAAKLYEVGGETGLGLVQRSPSHQLIRLAPQERDRGERIAAAARREIARRLERDGIDARRVLRALGAAPG